MLSMDDGENRMNEAFVTELGERLDEVEASEGPAALVTTGAGKFYSNGLDLDWLATCDERGQGAFIASLLALFGRVMSIGLPTVAAVNGHSFAGGGMLALAHDYRVMRSDRGYFCLPEIDILIPLVDGMTALIRERLRGPLLRDAVLTGKRFSGEQCVAEGFFDTAVPEERVVEEAVAMVAPLAGKDRATMRALKRGLYRDALAVLEDPVRSVASPV